MKKIEVPEETLPDTLSGMIRIALKDEDRAFRSVFHRIDMGGWHDPVWEDSVCITDDYKPVRCNVCLAGAVMAGTLKLEKELEGTPDLWPELCNRLQSLDNIRDGGIASALLEGEYDISSLPPHPICAGVVDLEDTILEKIGVAPNYFLENHESRKDWRKWMFRCAKELEAQGL